MLSSIDLDTVCAIVIKVREFDVKVAPEVDEPGDNPTDDADREIMFDYPDDPTAEEVRGWLESLNEDQSAELFALVLMGRGDYAGDWAGALAESRDNADFRSPAVLMSIPLLSDYLEEGLSQIGLSCVDVDLQHL
ncbi:MAG: DUF3775 domain-containing protein [Rhodospirillales bacterium]|nr:MAG: DUF3775 domain-containing protein [Rhodospirillales bacterium]